MMRKTGNMCSRPASARASFARGWVQEYSGSKNHDKASQHHHLHQLAQVFPACRNERTVSGTFSTKYRLLVAKVDQKADKFSGLAALYLPIKYVLEYETELTFDRCEPVCRQ